MITETDIAKCRPTHLRLLDALKNICDRHGLVFWLDFGTLLGAHMFKDFIPWDDDIDVSMPMKDYKKFLAIAEKELPRDIFLQTPKTDPGFKQCFAKLRDCYSTLLEHHETGNEPYHHGIYIDIFPSVYYPVMPHLLKKILLRTTVRSRALAVVTKEKVLMNYTIYFFCKFIWFLLSPFKGNKVGRTVEDNGYYEAIPDTLIYPLKPIEFAGGLYPGPHDPDAFLRKIWPNYTPNPPQESRIPHAKVILLDTPCDHPRALKRK